MGWTKTGNIMGPAGLPGGGSDIIGEVPSGALNGVNKDFVTTYEFLAGSLAVFLNGLRLRQGLDYSITGIKNFQLATAPVSADLLTTDYTVLGAAPTAPIYIGTKARWVALSNGTQLEVQDSGGTWIPQVSYTE